MKEAQPDPWSREFPCVRCMRRESCDIHIGSDSCGAYAVFKEMLLEQELPGLGRVTSVELRSNGIGFASHPCITRLLIHNKDRVFKEVLSPPRYKVLPGTCSYHFGGAVRATCLEYIRTKLKLMMGVEAGG